MNRLSEIMDKIIQFGNASEEAGTIDEKCDFCEQLLEIVNEMVEKYGPGLDGLEFPKGLFAKIDEKASHNTKKLFIFNTLASLIHSLETSDSED